MYIGDSNNYRVRKVTSSTNVVTTLAGTGTYKYSGDGGQATSASICGCTGINLDSDGNIYFNDGCNAIRKITVSTGIISTVAGNTSFGYNGDNMQATAATLYNPHDVVLDSYGNLYITDRYNHRVRKVDVSTGVISTVVGSGTASSTGDGSAATVATVNGPCYSRFDSSGNSYIVECEGNRVRKVTIVSTDIPTVSPSIQPTYYPSLSPHSISVISTIAGTGIAGYSGDNGQATDATIYAPAGLAFDSSGNVYFSEFYNQRIRKITASTGIITTYAGTGSCTYSGDGGAASSASLCLPEGLAIDASGNQSFTYYRSTTLTAIRTLLGNIYIGDDGNHRVRKITVSTGVISTIAGTGTASYSGDNGAATSATLYQPIGMALDMSGKHSILNFCI